MADDSKAAQDAPFLIIDLLEPHPIVGFFPKYPIFGSPSGSTTFVARSNSILPTWDSPITGLDVESIASAFMDRWAPERRPGDPESDAMIKSLMGLMKEAESWGATQIRDRFLSPRLRTVVLGGEGLGQFWECRFCRSTVPVGEMPNRMPHLPGCHLLTRGIPPEVETGRMDEEPSARIL